MPGRDSPAPGGREPPVRQEARGPEVVILKGTDVVRELARFAREHNFTYVVMGHTEKCRPGEYMRGSVVNRLVRALGDVDVQLVP